MTRLVTRSIRLFVYHVEHPHSAVCPLCVMSDVLTLEVVLRHDVET